MNNLTLEKIAPEAEKSRRPTPFFVPCSHSDREEYQYWLENQVEQGKLPDLVIEMSRLVGEGESSNAAVVTHYIRSVLDRLSLASTGQPSPYLRIYLSDVDGANCSVITKSPEPILILGLGMLEMMAGEGFGEDHLAAVFGHERFHLRRHAKWQHLKNSRPEETMGDIYGVMEAYDAGYNPRALGDLFKHLRAQDEQREHVRNPLDRVMDVHPPGDARIRNTEMALANLQLTKRLDRPWTPIPSEVLAAAQGVRHESFFEKYKQRTGFDTLVPVFKMRAIGKYFVTELERRHADDYGGYSHPRVDVQLMANRLGEAYADLEALRDGPGVAEEARAWLRRIMGIKSARYTYEISAQYNWALKQMLSHAYGKATPLQNRTPWERGFRVTMYGDERGGDMLHASKDLPRIFHGLVTGAQAFWDAGTPDEAISIADRQRRTKAALGRYMPGISAFHLTPDEPRWPSRNMIRKAQTDRETIRLPWENHVRWVLDETLPAQMRERLKQAAMQNGCDDPRLTGREIPEHRVRDMSGRDYVFADLHFNDAGNITDIEMSRREKLEVFRAYYKADSAAELYLKHEKLQAAREDAEKAAVIATDWNAMGRDFWGFVERHADMLEPFYSLVPGRFPFAQKFMQTLDALRAKAPKKWAKTYASFISGHDFNLNRKNKGNDYQSDKDTRVFSLPDLIRRAEDRYFGHANAYSVARHDHRTVRGALPQGHAHETDLAAWPDERPEDRVYTENKKTGEYSYVTRKPKKIAPARHTVNVRFHIDTNHPYAAAITAFNDPKCLTYPRKASLVTHFRHIDADAQDAGRYHLIRPSHVFNYTALRGHKAFARIDKRADDHRNDYSHNNYWDRARPFELVKMLRRNDMAANPQRISLAHFDYLTITEDFAFLNNKPLAKQLAGDLRRLVNRQLMHNRAIDFKAGVPLERLIDTFLAEHGEKRFLGELHNIFALRPRLEQSYFTHIRRRIDKLPLQDRIPHLEKLMGLQLKNPQYRNWAIDTWVDATGGQLGLDRGDAGYRAHTLKTIERSLRNMNGTQGLNGVVKLLDRIEAQQELAAATKDKLVDYYGQRFLEKDAAMRLIESAVETCGSRADLRAAFLKYITEPLSPKGTRAFADLLKRHAGESFSRFDFVKEFCDPKQRLQISPRQEATIVDYLHQNFWSMPFELRTVYLDRILFPVHETREEEFSRAVTFVLDKVLPQTRKFAPESREALLVYLDCCPTELRRATFSAILATVEESAKSGAMRPGQVLSHVLARTGAAGGQILQAAHSYLGGLDLSDPDLCQLRDDLKSSKVNFARPLRWEIGERMDEALPPEHKASIRRVGAVLGSGSTAYVVACEYPDGSETALKLMRRDVAPVADLQFERFFECFEKLAQKHALYAPLPAMVDHARQLIQVSTRGDIAAAQVRYAQQSYDGLTINVGGAPYGFVTAPVIAHGGEYLETARVHGPHLNDMPTGAVHTRNNAIAIETAEIYRMLQGRAIDQDRHGGQQKVNDVIGVFDVGGLPYDVAHNRIALPSHAEKFALGQVLGLTMNDVSSGVSPAQALVDAVTTREWGAAKSYLVGIKRAFLARTDVHQHFGATPQARDAVHRAIITAAWKSGQVDRQVFAGFSDTLAASTWLKLGWRAATGSGMASSAPAVSITDRARPARAKTLEPVTAGAIVATSFLQKAFKAMIAPRSLWQDDGGKKPRAKPRTKTWQPGPKRP